VTQRGVRTYKRRAGRVTATQARALRDLWPALGVAVDGGPLDVVALFGRRARVALEVGFGMGEATVALAAAQRDWDVLAVDVHTPGHGNLLKLVAAQGLGNVRVASGDGRVLLADMLAPASLHAVRVFFPDPWPKSRHAKRRLLTGDFLDLVADRLAEGGHLHVATDAPAYAAQVAAALDAHPRLRPTGEVPWRPTTRFESRARAAGRTVRDVAARRAPR
jgi:tRNA (guanine-N7-)-methyltransferase